MSEVVKDIKPIVLRDTETGDTYTLEFSRASVVFAERRGFRLESLSDKPMTAIPELFYYSFMKNHPKMTREKTDDILFNQLGGLSEQALTRLGELYALPYNSLLNDGESKNSNMVVEM